MDEKRSKKYIFLPSFGYKSTGDNFTKNSVPVVTGDKTDGREGTEKNFSIPIWKNSLKGRGWMRNGRKNIYFHPLSGINLPVTILQENPRYPSRPATRPTAWRVPTEFLAHVIAKIVLRDVVERETLETIYICTLFRVQIYR